MAGEAAIQCAKSAGLPRFPSSTAGASCPIYQQIYEELRESILAGRCRNLCSELRSISPLDDDGLRIDRGEAILRTRKPRFIDTVPSLHDPTGATLKADRRQRLFTIAGRARIGTAVARVSAE